MNVRFSKVLIWPILLIAIILLCTPNHALSKLCQDKQNSVIDANEKLVETFITAVNSGSREKMDTFIKQNYDPGLLKQVPSFTIGNFCLAIYYESGGLGFELKQVLPLINNTIGAIAYNRLTETFVRINIPVSGTEPLKIAGIIEAKLEGNTENIQTISKSELVSRLKICIELAEKDDEFSGAVLLAKNGKVLLEKNCGYANKSFNIANTSDTRFNLASVGKIFTGLAIVQLVEQGKISFNDTLDKYLPTGWLNPEISRQIQIKHLLTHTSGLGDYFRDINAQNKILWFRELADYRALIADDTLTFEPGTKFAYSNTGMLLLGVIIEQVTQINYFDFLQKNIFEPADMVHTGGFSKDRSVPNMATGYTKIMENEQTNWDSHIATRVLKGSPSGGIYSSLNDMFRFDSALWNNKFLTQQSGENLLQGHPELNASFHSYGFFISETGIGRELYHTGDGSGVNCIYRTYPDAGYTLIILSNYSRPSAGIISNVWSQLITKLKTE